MRVVMMGTGTFAEPTFEALLASRHQVVGLVTQPDRAIGEKRGSTRQVGKGMKEIALERGIPVLQPESINTPDGVVSLRNLNSDLLVVAAYGQILSRDVLGVPPKGGINVHASLLPKYRGAAPVAWAIWKGERETGICIIRMTTGLDAGDVLARGILAIEPQETAGELESRLGPLGATLAVDIVDRLEAGPVIGEPQDKTQATKAPKLTKVMGLIDWSHPADIVANHIRAMQPWPTAYTFLHRPMQPPLRVIVARALPRTQANPSSAADGSKTRPTSDGAGTLLPGEAGLLVHCGGETLLDVLELQPAGKRRMNAADFLRGHSLPAGSRFGPEIVPPGGPFMIERPLRWTARSLALYVLVQARKKEAFVQDLLESAFRDVPLSAIDRALATQLVYGVFRRRGTLDVLLRHVVSRPPREVEPWLWEALRLGVFQLLFLSRIPAYGALNETVELAVDFGAPQAKGFLNGNLRALTRLLTADLIDKPGPNAVPIAAGQFRRLAEAALPDPTVRPVEYASVGLSLPDWLVRRWLPRWGWDEVIRLGFWFADQPELWLRINTARIGRDEYLARLKAAHIPATAGMHSQAVAINESTPIRDLPGYDEGWFVVQDLSAMLVASALQPQPGWRVLDLCAAPGGKTTHLAELMHDQGHIVACDRDAKRLEPLKSTLDRLGLKSIEVLGVTDDKDAPSGPFDAALVDVPCSNTGVLGRRPEARWRLSEKEIVRMAPLQTKLLHLACERVKLGGAVVYSTCSIEPEENGKVITSVLQASPGFILEADNLSMPGLPADGGYWARLRKNGNH